MQDRATCLCIVSLEPDINFYGYSPLTLHQMANLPLNRVFQKSRTLDFRYFNIKKYSIIFISSDKANSEKNDTKIIWFGSLVLILHVHAVAAPGGGRGAGGWNNLSTQRSFIPSIPHYEICVENFLKSEKKMCRSPPPPPAERLFQGWRSSSDTFAIFAPPKQTPWRRPCVHVCMYNHFLKHSHLQILLNLHKLFTAGIAVHKFSLCFVCTDQWVSRQQCIMEVRKAIIPTKMSREWRENWKRPCFEKWP